MEQKEADTFFEKLITALEKSQKQTLRTLKRNHKTAVKWLGSKGHDISKVSKNVAGQVGKGAVTAAIVASTSLPLTAISTPSAAPVPVIEIQEDIPKSQDLSELGKLITALRQKQDRPAEDLVVQTLSKLSGLDLASKIDGYGLNRILGRIGTEQHLYRYPGESISDHLPDLGQRKIYGPSGIAPHPGAWGYFAAGKGELTPDLIEKEKYYLAVQTFMIPEWNSNWSKLKEWFKYRKMLVYNPQNGKAVVAVVADAGPATWTGKHFGGSPEVMEELKLTTGNRSGEIVILLINDPENLVPLGPLKNNVGIAFFKK